MAFNAYMSRFESNSRAVIRGCLASLTILGLLMFGIDRVALLPIAESSKLPVRYSQLDRYGRSNQWSYWYPNHRNTVVTGAVSLTAFFSNMKFYIVSVWVS